MPGANGCDLAERMTGTLLASKLPFEFRDVLRHSPQATIATCSLRPHYETRERCVPLYPLLSMSQFQGTSENDAHTKFK